jgi:hypothetical protein
MPMTRRLPKPSHAAAVCDKGVRLLNEVDLIVFEVHPGVKDPVFGKKIANAESVVREARTATPKWATRVTLKMESKAA